MSTIKQALGFAFLCLILLVGSAFAATPATELLYVQQGQNVITYSANKTTAVTQKLGTLATNYGSVVSINRSGSFLYILGFSSTNEYFSVYGVTAAGVPTGKLVQTLAVKPALSQFYIHPNGTLAYAVYAWIVSAGHDAAAYLGDVVLFRVSPKTGKLVNTTKTVFNFPVGLCESGSPGIAPSIYGFSRSGSKLYTVDSDSGEISSFTINTTSGLLESQTVLFAQDNKCGQYEQAVFSDSIIEQVNNPGGPPFSSAINIFQNTGAFQSLPLFSCTSAMLLTCGDNIGPSVWMHPSSKYIFVADQSTNQAPILYISLPLKKLEPSGAYIPGIPTTVAFSPDGLLVYAVEGSEILVYAFNPHSGLLTAKTTISAPGVLSLLPWQ